MEDRSTKLRLLQSAVNARRAYWDAIRALEKSIAPGEEFSDTANDAVHDDIGSLAAGSETASVTEGHLRRIEELARH
ncbi:hypothetical protein [Cupriavidus metallidurans]|uniref:hypothetical protein n=1 Tax=Cupriavidus metallidurans TaxID=119219 RepID=UPI001CCCDE36|nr:hypothetical protein [Cupriavidus metallidurans]UBM12733.1 hypothetical protein LAI70_28380 [Cupriavidus metallidurans]